MIKTELLTQVDWRLHNFIKISNTYNCNIHIQYSFLNSTIKFPQTSEWNSLRVKILSPTAFTSARRLFFAESSRKSQVAIKICHFWNVRVVARTKVKMFDCHSKSVSKLWPPIFCPTSSVKIYCLIPFRHVFGEIRVTKQQLKSFIIFREQWHRMRSNHNVPLWNPYSVFYSDLDYLCTMHIIELMINKARHEIRIVNTARWP